MRFVAGDLAHCFAVTGRHVDQNGDDLNQNFEWARDNR